MSKLDSIIDTMKSTGVRTAVADLESLMQRLSLTPQEQMAALAIVAAKQVSVLPVSNEDACEVFADLIGISLSL